MALFCLPKNKVEKLKNSALRGEIDIKKLYKMTSKERRDFFTEYTDESLGKLLNVEFEKAMISKQQDAITDWAKSVFKPEARSKQVYKNIIDKIKTLDDMGVLTPATEDAFLEDLVSDKLGVTVSPEEIQIINDKAKVIDAAQKKLGMDVGNPKKLEENLAFFKAKKEMDDYLQSLAPTSNLKVLTGTIGRGMMLASVKSPLLNIGSNIEIGFMEALRRRITSKGLKGSDNTLAVDYVKMVNKIYQETGYDVSRMINLNDTGASGQRVLGDTVHSEGKGGIRKVGRVVEDVVFKQLMGAPDVAFSSAHFADSANINSLKLAKGDAKKGTEIMNDAMRLEPQTAEGEFIREQAILDAQVATWTNRTWASDISEGIRKIFNKVSGDLRVGDYIMPFVKTPANVIATSMDYAGLGIPRTLLRTIKAWRSGDIGSKEFNRKTFRDLARAGLGLVTAAAIVSTLDDDDFVGAYDPQRAQIEQLRNSNTNSIRVGDKWVSVDWLGPLSVPVTAMLYARKYGNSPAESLFQYSRGVGSQVQKIPGISDASDYFRKQVYKKDSQTLKDAISATGDYATGELYTRLIPSFISDISKATDKFERKTSGKIDTIKSKIPGLRQTLPKKTTIFGEEMKGESAVSDILFGSRVRTDHDSDVLEELRDVSNETDKAINFTNWDTSSNKSLAQFRQKVGGDTYDEAKVEYGKELKTSLDKLLNSSAYQKMDANEKLQAVNNLDTLALKKVLKKEGFTYKKENTTKIESEKNLIQLAAEYAEAYSVDPENAFKAMFTGEQLDEVKGNLVGLKRFEGKDYNGPGGSEEYIKKELAKAGIPWSERSKYNLEHITPVAAGGDTSPENLFIADRATHDSYTPLDTLAAKKIKEGSITRKEVTRIMTNLKVTKIITLEQARKELDK